VTRTSMVRSLLLLLFPVVLPMSRWLPALDSSIHVLLWLGWGEAEKKKGRNERDLSRLTNRIIEPTLMLTS
jgi:hypothetical protein